MLMRWRWSFARVRRRTLAGSLSQRGTSAPLLVTLLTLPALVQAQEPVQPAVPSWEELQARPFPSWFQDAKLGIFIHWGVYSVPAYSGREQYAEWFLRGLQEGDTLRTRFLEENYGEGFEYPDFAPLFKAELFDPDEWADLFRRTGARYVVMVSKHHDGYALWPSAYSPGWNSVDVGPERNLVGELTYAVRKAGLRMGLYYSLAEWNHPLHRWYTDPPDSIGPYVEQHMIPQFKELVEAYRPDVLFADGEWSNSAEQWHARELISWYFDTVGPDAVVNNRWGTGSDIGFLTPEYSAGLEVTDRPWTEVRGLGRSFGLNRNEPLEAYMSPDELVRRFVTAVAAGGGMILNVGPQADGQIPLVQQERLLQLGRWLDQNWEAVYGSRPWEKTGEDREVTLERVDPTIDFDWVRNTPGKPISEDHFSVTWTGYLQPRFTEAYTFDAEADDGIRVWLDDRLVLDQWDETPAEEAPATIVRLEADRKYPIRVEYREDDVNAWVRLFWSSPSQEREILPRGRLYSSSRRIRADGLQGLYRSPERSMAYTQKDGDLFAIFFEWPDRELALPLSPPPTDLEIRLLGLDGALPWRARGDTVYVDLSGIPFQEIPGQWAWTLCLEGYAAWKAEGR